MPLGASGRMPDLLQRCPHNEGSHVLGAARPFNLRRVVVRGYDENRCGSKNILDALCSERVSTLIAARPAARSDFTRTRRSRSRSSAGRLGSSASTSRSPISSFRQRVPIRNTSGHGDAGAKRKRNPSITRCVDEFLASIASARRHQPLGFLHRNTSVRMVGGVGNERARWLNVCASLTQAILNPSRLLIDSAAASSIRGRILN
jgi:hypothetical protein